MPDPVNLPQAIAEEVERCTELAGVYDSLGPAGAFGAEAIRVTIKAAQKALGSGDPLAMMPALDNLRSCE